MIIGLEEPIPAMPKNSSEELKDHGIILEDADREILKIIAISNDLYKKAKQELVLALAIHRDRHG